MEMVDSISQLSAEMDFSDALWLSALTKRFRKWRWQCDVADNWLL
jgi:hypothetical protein